MAWLDFLKNGNELSELLIEGQNPYADKLLDPSDVQTIRPHLHPTERVLAYVLGRVVHAGRGLWVLTDQQVLISQEDDSDRVHAIVLRDISHGECLKGKYGYTLRVTAAGQTFSVYGTSAHMAASFYRELARTVDCTPVFKPPHLDADDLDQVAHNFSDAASKLTGAGSTVHQTLSMAAG